MKTIWENTRKSIKVQENNEEKTPYGSSYCKFFKSVRLVIAVLINYTKICAKL